MEYNTSRDKILLPEYGRNVKKMVDFLLTIEDKNERTVQSEAVIKVMSQVLPGVKNDDEYNENLWSHLFLMADYKLDVDCPFNIQPEEVIEKIRPEKPKYTQLHKTITVYGNLIEELIAKAIMYDEDDKYFVVLNIANQMKKLYLMWNNESVSDAIIIKNLIKLSNGKLVLPDDTRLTNVKDVQFQRKINTNKNQNNNKRRSNTNQGRKNQNYKKSTKTNYSKNPDHTNNNSNRNNNNNQNQRMKFA